MKTKICPKCSEELEESAKYWYRNKNAPDGWKNVCKACDDTRRTIQRARYSDECSETWKDDHTPVCPLVLPLYVPTKSTMSREKDWGKPGPYYVYACMTWGDEKDENGERFPTKRHSVWLYKEDALKTQERLNNG